MKDKFDKNKLLVDPNEDLYRWKVDAYPSLIYAVCCDMVKSPYGWPESEGFFLGHDFYWFNNWRDIWAHGDKYIETFLSHSRGSLPVRCRQKYNHAFKRLQREITGLSQVNISQLNQADLRRHWYHFFQVYSHFWYIVTDIEVLSYAASHRLEELVAAQKINLSGEELSQLTAFPQQSYIMEEEYELLKIAREASPDKREKKLKYHARKFSWILNGYHGQRLVSSKYFVERLAKLRMEKKSAAHYRYLRNYYRGTIRRFFAIVNKYDLNKEIIKYAKLAQESSCLQDRRKALSWQATDQIIALYRRFAQFLGVSLEQSLYILRDEFDYALKNKNKIITKIKRRQRSCRLQITAERTTISTEAVRPLLSIFEREYARAAGRQVKGLVAYPGRVRGRVQVIASGREIKDFKVGRILVVMMTSPDYIMAMKKAKAIVTDDGGLTSHAAIVARELKKPCIVGTRNATKLLKDGDEIVVDAKQGIIKIISRLN